MRVIPFSDGSGSVARHEDWSSRYVSPRPVDVWLPPGYATSSAYYPVVYMQDGRWLFDSGPLDGGVDWGVDEAVVQLIADESTGGAIVVGVWTTPELRSREYTPQRPLEAPGGEELLAQFSAERGGAPISDRYLDFLVREVKPFVDRTYRTMSEARFTTIMGASLGGLLALYALVEHPDVFGSAGCLSTHWPIGGDLVVDYMGRALPPAGDHQVYFDYGTAGLDGAYEPFQQRMDSHMRAAGYIYGRDWLTCKFEGADHNEAAWRERVQLPLGFLLAE